MHIHTYQLAWTAHVLRTYEGRAPFRYVRTYTTYVHTHKYTCDVTHGSDCDVAHSEGRAIA